MRVTILTGGIGGAKLVLGFATLLGAENVTAIVNTGDDFRHLGLMISPDLDTLLYTLSGKSDPLKGWGRVDETWTFLETIRSLGGPDWFMLGDGDLALHVLRSQRLAEGVTLSRIMADFAQAWGVGVSMLPMTDDVVATIVETAEGEMPFQTYFVARRCEPAVSAIRFEGADASLPAPGVLSAIHEADAIVIAPSNPYLSIDPILAVPGIRDALRKAPAPNVAVSPIANGQAFKGPTAKLMRELGLPVETETIGAHYADIIDGLVIDHREPAGPESLPTLRTDIAMPSLGRKVALAAESLDFARRLRLSPLD